MQKHFILLILFLASIVASAQDNNGSLIQDHFITAGLEAGIVTLAADMNEKDFIRGDVSANQGYNSYNGYSPTSNVYSSSIRSFYGLKAEIATAKNVVFSSGLRFTNSVNNTGKERFYSGKSSSFYWFWKADGVNTDYLRVEELTQKVLYLGIPLEIKLYMVNWPCCRWYLKAGAEFNFLLNSRTDLIFHEEAMEVHEADLVKMVPDPRSFNSSLYGAGGITFGRNYLVNVELMLPFVILSPEKDAIISPIVGTGLKIDFMIPIKNKTYEN